MKYYVGLDVSMEETSICIVNQSGEIIQEGTAFSDPEALSAYLKRAGLRYERIGIEASCLTAWLCRGLEKEGLPAICIETRHANATLKVQRVKTDKNDARGIAHIMRTGWYKPVHIKSTESQKLRMLINNRRHLLNKRLDVDNQMRGTLKVFGLKVGKVGAKVGFEQRILELIEGEEELTNYIIPMLVVRRALQEQYLKLEKMILDYVEEDELCRRFMTIPGVGPITALLFKTTIDNPQRFKRSRDVGTHLGLTPRKYASGEVDYNGGITKCGDGMLRQHLFEGGKVLLSRVLKWSPLKAWGMKLAQRSTIKNACTALARKIAIIMHRMWMDGTEFNWGKAPQTA